jgi:hypothetical protein
LDYLIYKDGGQMPDRDNLPKSFSNAWQGTEGRAQHGSEHLAEWAAYKIVNHELLKLAKHELFEILATKLEGIANCTSKEREISVLEAPRNAEQTRETLTVLKAAERIAVELALDPSATFSREQFAMEICLEIARVNCMGPLEIRGTQPTFPTVEATREMLGKFETALRPHLVEAARALAENPSTPKLPKFKKPNKPKRDQTEMVKERLLVNAAALGEEGDK